MEASRRRAGILVLPIFLTFARRAERRLGNRRRAELKVGRLSRLVTVTQTDVPALLTDDSHYLFEVCE